MSQPDPVIAIVGPTGTGKSDLAVDLAVALDGEIVNADALQLYRGMDIGTAKLPLADRRGVPHHLLDVLDVTDEASVAAYQRQARDVIDAITARGRRAILVGGSGLYVRAALDRLELPGTDPAVRARLEREAGAAGLPTLRDRLAAVDPVAAGRLHDARRVIRALEVHEITGRPFSSFMPDRRYVRPAVQLGLRRPTPSLRERLAARVRAMVAGGLAQEVARLDAAGLRRGRTASRAIGYAQFLAVADGTLDQADAVADTITATQRFAKRQRTWFGADPRVHWLDVEGTDRDGLLEAALTRLRS
ncbi:tRNA (adenosine(37)-N6)-dimethylallyltransferase MiaA [Tersicoccus phoenicis]|uniref:tRNA dimethylallyltransferase n=1 Tax=Tersicoccus phoenicis TaxID=554083 RepID=A0A1R1L9K1_9MICC|nr:tRNA (adenosine(37)-N6)-dimethylallyltransferase MiaA [Tersicoccus phoenicis]OMH24216.1 tRNA (adenosine(37)-N6)-dimethylallyltransferase MiaA [Tersicoccus phoenicis]